MAKRIFQQPTWTPSAQADGTLAANSYMAVAAGSATQMVNVMEFYLGGQATASAPAIMLFARHSTLAVGPSALALPLTDGPLSGTASALSSPTVTFITVATTQPARAAAATVARMNLSFNAFGGIVRWVAAPGEEWVITGTTASTTESSLSAFTGSSGSALMGSHIIYEPF